MVSSSNGFESLISRNDDYSESSKISGSNHIADVNPIELKIKNILRDNLNLNVPNDRDILKKPLRDLGLNSIKYISLLVAIESEFGFEFDDVFFRSNTEPTISSLTSIIEESLNTRRKGSSA